MYQSKTKSIFVVAACLVALISASAPRIEGQVFDKIMNTISENNGKPDTEIISNGPKDLAGEREQQLQQPIVSRTRDMFKDLMSVNVPIFYDMVRNGSSMGINVLSGLVEVKRGEEAERSGLVSNGGRRPLSVRVFGIPIFERGTRVRPHNSGSSSPVEPNGSRPSSPGPDEEELPL